MRSLAIVVGVDRYDNPAYDLGAGVSDALRFATWALDNGCVAPQDLFLLLSPKASGPANREFLPATSRVLLKVVKEVVKGFGRGSDRLFFYFAGHGLSTPGAVRGKDEPTICLSDSIDEMGVNSNLALGLSEVFSALGVVEPRQQFFFIDACRDFAGEASEIPAGHLGLPIPLRMDPRPRSQQYILFAGSTGQRVHEEGSAGRGCFGAGLCEELYGRGISKVWSQASQRYEVRFAHLVDVLSKQIHEQGRKWRPHDWERYIQVPVANAEHMGEDPVLIDFALQDIKDVPLRLRLRPSRARRNAHVRLFEFVRGMGDFVVIAEQPPPSPIPLPCRFDHPPGQYSIAVEADGFQPRREPVDLCMPWELDWQLERDLQVTPPADPPARTPGVLELLTNDASVVLTVRDAERRLVRDLEYHQLVESDYGDSDHWQPRGKVFARVPPGYYYVALEPPGEPADERLVEVLPGETTRISLRSPATRIGVRQRRALNRHQIEADPEGYLHASEALSGLAAAQLASVLSFAAFRAISVEGGMFRLESLGLAPFRDIAREQAGLLVLIGVGGERPSTQIEARQFLRGSRMVLLDLRGNALSESGFEGLHGFPYAAQQRLHLSPGQHVVELRVPGFRPTRFAVAALPHRVTTLVLSVEDGGKMLVEQFLFPVGRHNYRYADDFLANAQLPGAGAALQLQHLETVQRYYLNGQQLPARPLRLLLWGKWVDPLLGCVAGYGLRPNKPSAERRSEEDRFTLQAMHNMVKYFGELPDSHVLAGIYEPELRDTHFAAATTRGLPIFAEGFHLLHRWHKESGLPLPEHLAAPVGNLVFTSPWTAWVA